MADTVSDDTRLDEPDPTLRECHDCGLFQRLPRLRPGLVADCPRCGAVLRRRMRNSFGVTVALMLTGIALFTIVLYAPLIGMDFYGRSSQTSLPALPLAFERFGMWELSFVVLMVTIVAPLLKLVLTAGVMIGLQMRVEPWLLAAMARVRAWLGPWAMTEVFLLGLFVAYTRLTAYGRVDIGPALYAMAGLMLVMVAADAWLDEHAMWEAIGSRRTPPPPGRGEPIGCDTCGHVTCGEPGDLCYCCDSRLRFRKLDSIARCWALVIAAAALYVPANILPVMTLIRAGQTTTSTIIGGVKELIAYKMWPLALIVFVASIAVPMAKLMMLIYMLITTQRGSAHQLRHRTQIYRLVEVIGRWSMIDVFMISILTALVQMGFLATVIPENGAICFCGVVIMTMIASASFDPRVMWDRAVETHPALVEQFA